MCLSQPRVGKTRLPALIVLMTPTRRYVPTFAQEVGAPFYIPLRLGETPPG